MVGVAGRSKGCATCRRRKLKCDLGKPTCETCQKSNRLCEGYDRYPVFLVRTVGGFEKRRPLEEAKPLSLPIRDGSTRPEMQQAKVALEAHRAQRPPQALATQTNLVGALTPALCSFHSSPMEAVRYINYTYELYIESPDGRNRYPHMPISDFYHAILSHGSSDQALDAATLAMATCGQGLARNDRQMLEESREIYGRALRALQYALHSPNMAMKDETLAVSCLMALYEWSNPGQDWLSHIAGICTLFLARGPEKQRGTLALRAFESCRYNLMLYCISKRKALGFDTNAWVHEPWSGCDKGLGQQIMDHGFIYTAVLEKLDDFVNQLHTTERVRKIVRRCMVSMKALQRLFGMLEECSLESDTSEEEDIYQDTNRILLQITAMMLELGLSSSARAVLDRADGLIGPDLINSQISAAPNQHTQKTLEKEIPECNQQTSLAKGIVQKAGVVMERRLIAVDRLLLPLEMASQCLQDSPCPEYQQSFELRRQLLGLARKG